MQQRYCKKDTKSDQHASTRFLPDQGDVQQAGQGEDHFQLAEAEQAAPVQYGLTTMGRNRAGQPGAEQGRSLDSDGNRNGHAEGAE